MFLKRKNILFCSPFYNVGVNVLAILTIVIFFCNSATAQIKRKTTISISKDSLITKDTVEQKDSLSKTNWEEKLGIKISKDALSDIVTATAEDSAIADIKHNLFSFYGSVKVNYQDKELNAPLLHYYQKENLVIATPCLFDSTQKSKLKPSFKQGAEEFFYDTLKYNFQTQKALVRNARSQYGQGFVNSQQVKRNPDQSIYGWKNVYTTCDLDTPHFGIRANKIKVIPGRIAVTGSANFEIEGIPTPLFLPFGVFPITEGQRSGFILPQYNLENIRGLGFTGGGYYFHPNEFVDVKLISNIYSKGSWGINVLTNYFNRYHYNGNFSFAYSLYKNGEIYEPNSTITKSFALKWAHASDAKAKPGLGFRANIDFQTGNYYALNSYNPNQILNNQYSSNISFSKSWQNKPYSFTSAITYIQNTQKHSIDLTLPNISFFMGNTSPFENKHGSGVQKWYEKITIGYSFNALGYKTFADTNLSLSSFKISDFKIGAKHNIPISASYHILRFINLNFNINYNEYWLGEKFTQAYNYSTNNMDTSDHKGIYTARDYSASMGLNTRIYGTKFFKKGKIAGIRHVITPSVSLNYTPDYYAKPYEYYYRTIIDTNNKYENFYSKYPNSPVGMPGLGQYGKFSSIINFGLANNLQLKVRNKKDTVHASHNITLIDGFSISTNYNLAADSFNWSTINMNFHTNLFNKININIDAAFDPYKYDYSFGKRSKISMWDAQQGIARFLSSSATLSSSFRSKQTSGNTTKTLKTDEYSRLMRFGGYNDYVDFNIPWSLNLSYTGRLTKVYRTASNHGDTLELNHYITFSGDFNITSLWKFAYSSGYDFAHHSLSFTSIDIYRDLHCFEIRLGAIPFGIRKSFSFTLSAKASVLQDLKLIRKRDYRDAIY